MVNIVILSIFLITNPFKDPLKINQIFEIAREEFKENFKPDKLLILLNDLIGGKEVDDFSRIELKLLRKKGSVLRNAYNLFDQTHEAPEALCLFDDRLGDLNDAIATQIPDLIAYRASLLRESFELQEFSFSPASPSSFKDYTNQLFTNLEILLSLKELRAEQFHEIRWTMKKFLNLLYLQEQIESTPDRKTAYEVLYQFNQEMGAIHDEVVQADLRGELVYEEQTIPLPTHIKEEIFRFMSAF